MLAPFGRMLVSGKGDGRHNDSMTEAKRRIPAWLLGLIIAAVLFGIGFLVFRALGFGDNPVLEDAAVALRSL